jgi:hypothetical protein
VVILPPSIGHTTNHGAFFLMMRKYRQAATALKNRAFGRLWKYGIIIELLRDSGFDILNSVLAKKSESKMGKKKLQEADLKSFLEGLKAAKERVATDPAGAKANADQLKRFIDTYEEYFKQLAAKPGKPPATGKNSSHWNDQILLKCILK